MRPFPTRLVAIIAAAAAGGALAGLAMPAISGWSIEVRADSAAASRSALQRAVVREAFRASGADFRPVWPAVPPTPTPDGERETPLNPFAVSGYPNLVIDPDGEPRKKHPVVKTVEGRLVLERPGAVWYNPANGVVRFCVPRQRTDRATLDLYNRVNSCAITDIRQTSP